MARQASRAWEKFATRVEQYLNSRKPSVVTDVEKVGGKDLAQVQAAVNKTTIGLPLVENMSVATLAQAQNPNDDGTLLTPVGARQAADKLLEIDNKIKGNALHGMNAAGGLRTGKLCYRLNIVSNATEMDAVMNAKESFQEVFNNWTRFSHNGTLTYPADPTELNVWNYDAVNDKIICTKNSNTHIGFISAEAYDDFEFEVEVSSTNGDDDRIGICIAFSQAGGRQYTLTAVRQFDGWGGASNSFHVTYNMLHVQSRVLAFNDAGLGPQNPYHNSLGTLKTGWAGVGWVRIKVRRTGDLIEAWTTLPQSAEYLEDKKITINLASDPDLVKFRGPQRFGYVCQSQLNSTWRSIQRPGERVPIIRTDTKECYRWENNQWTLQPAGSYQNYLQPNRLFTNQVTKRLFAVDAAFNMLPIGKR